MRHRRTWWSGSIVFLLCIIFAGVIVNIAIQTPNNVAGGASVMVLIILLGVSLRALLQLFMNRWQRRNDRNLRRDE